MNQVSKKKSILSGLGMFIIVMLSMIFIASPLQGNFGMVGLLLTEVMFLILAVGGVLLTKGSLKEIFSIKKPALRQTVATLILWMASYLLVLFSTIVCAYLFPESFSNVSSSMTEFFTAVPFWAQFLIVAVSPAICEEAVHRGFILHTFKDIKRPWVIVLSMGVIFGIFHLSPFRFVQTAILGACMTWVMLKTENVVLPALFHGVNNLLPVLISFALQDALTSVSAVTTADGPTATAVAEVVNSGWAANVGAIGMYMMLGLVALPLMLAGTALLKKKGEKIKGNHVAVVFILAGAMFFIGLAMLIGASVSLVAQGIGM